VQSGSPSDAHNCGAGDPPPQLLVPGAFEGKVGFNEIGRYCG